jgi:hypothetical protein
MSVATLPDSTEYTTIGGIFFLSYCFRSGTYHLFPLILPLSAAIFCAAQKRISTTIGAGDYVQLIYEI